MLDGVFVVFNFLQCLMVYAKEVFCLLPFLMFLLMFLLCGCDILVSGVT